MSLEMLIHDFEHKFWLNVDNTLTHDIHTIKPTYKLSKTQSQQYKWKSMAPVQSHFVSV